MSKVDEISQKINESCFLCQNIGQVLIWMILDVSKCSIYDVKHPIFLIFRWPQTPHTANYLKEFCKQSYFMKTKVPVTYWVQFVTLSGYLWHFYESVAHGLFSQVFKPAPSYIHLTQAEEIRKHAPYWDINIHSSD